MMIASGLAALFSRDLTPIIQELLAFPNVLTEGSAITFAGLSPQ